MMSGPPAAAELLHNKSVGLVDLRSLASKRGILDAVLCTSLNMLEVSLYGPTKLGPPLLFMSTETFVSCLYICD